MKTAYTRNGIEVKVQLDLSISHPDFHGKPVWRVTNGDVSYWVDADGLWLGAYGKPHMNDIAFVVKESNNE